MTGIIDFAQWAETAASEPADWLLLGKGPTFARLGEVPLERFRVCTLNHVIREVPADIAHIIDIDVAVQCAQALQDNAKAVLMPYHPHEDHKPSAKTLHQYATDIPVLARLAEQGRLIAYNLSTSERRHGKGPVIPVKFFSAEAALNLLVALGARKVRSLGVDGGNQYSTRFEDLNDTTRLANGHASFDQQFRSIARTLMQSDLDYAPWYIDAPIKVFVGTDHAQMAGVKVLEHSIKKHASVSVSVQAIDDTDIPVPVEPKNRSKTGFSFSRFHIPALCDYQGRGIYLDADMLVFSDIARVWTADMQDNHVLYSVQESGGQRIPQFSVMLLDCGSLDWDVKKIVGGLDAGTYDYPMLMQKLCITDPARLGALLPQAWNSLEHYEAGKTCLLHYTDMPTQPWVSHDNPFGNLWYAAAREAIDDGFISRDFIYDEVARGNVSPDLPNWLGLPAPADYTQLAQSWVPPFRRFSGSAGKAGPSPAKPTPVNGARPSALANARDALARQSPTFLRNTYRKVRGLVRGY